MTLVLLLLAATPASEASALAKARRWNELLLAFEARRPASLSAKDRVEVSRALTHACQATEGDEPSLAQAAGEKAVELEPTADALACAGAAAVHNRQPGAAEELLRKGLAAFPKDGRFPLELARLFYMEQDDAQATSMVAKVPRKSAQYAEAQELAAKLAKRSGGGRAAPAGVDWDAEDGAGPPPIASARPGAKLKGAGITGLGYESSVDGEGRRVRQNSYFRFRYFSGQRDFGQRAEYEGEVQDALEEARRSAKRVLGLAREEPLEVILYSRAEFALHFGGGLARTVAGFYSENAIRMNDSAELTSETRATLVHEYVHAIIDERAGFTHGTVPMWLHEGLAEYVRSEATGEAGPSPKLRQALAVRAQAGTLPPLTALRSTALVAQANPVIAYAVATFAVQLMIKRSSVSAVLELIAALGRGAPLEKVFERTVGKDLASFDDELRDLLAKP